MKNEISFAEWKIQFFRLDFDENLAEFFDFFTDNVRIWGKVWTIFKISGKFHQKPWKKVEIVKIFIFHFIISSVSLTTTCIAAASELQKRTRMAGILEAIVEERVDRCVRVGRRRSSDPEGTRALATRQGACGRAQRGGAETFLCSDSFRSRKCKRTRFETFWNLMIRYIDD